MKKLSIMILTLLAVITACKKVPEVNKEYVDVERDLITVGTTTATIQCDYEYIATLKKAFLYYGEGEDATDMNVAEMSVVQKTLYVELAGLKENTTYSYYYEFVNGFNSMKSATKSFKTELISGGGSGNDDEGALFGLFSVAPDRWVRFSKGNLQYQASTNIWRFAEHQWDYVGDYDKGNVFENGVKCNNSMISSSYDGWIDLFGWGTSGYDNSANDPLAINYQPWAISLDVVDTLLNKTGYGPSLNQLDVDLVGTSANYDWGVFNAISNGRSEAGLWRTLSFLEASYLFSQRNDAIYKLAPATVLGVHGLVVLPDEWHQPNGVSFVPNANNWDVNIYTESQWHQMENAGAVFLPASGFRSGHVLWNNYIEFQGIYWTTTASYSHSSSVLNGHAVGILFDPSGFHHGLGGARNEGRAVRLVIDDPPHSNNIMPTVITSDVLDITANSANCNGIVTNVGSSYTVNGICWGLNENPTMADNFVLGSHYGAGNFTSSLNGLEANTMYHVRAYATNSAGTAYGEDKEFVTLSGGGSGDHEYVDLGLPSGTLWATCNVGANAPEEYGDYFAWGETQTKSTYNWGTYKYCNGDYNQLTKYCNDASYGYNGFADNLTTLLPEDDAATANWGSDWCMPTTSQWVELYMNTSNTWTTQNGVSGRLFTSANGASLFLPAAGGRWDDALGSVDSLGRYWSKSSLEEIQPYFAWHFLFDSDHYLMFNIERSLGQSVRAVRSARQN